MQGRSHATFGARSIGARRHAPTWGDAFGSSALVGSITFDGRPVRDEPSLEQMLEGGSPVDVARAWLADPARIEALPPSLLDYASRTLDIAEAHFRELDELAGRLAADADAVGVVDPARLQRVDALAESLDRYANALRRLLDLEATSAQVAEQRIRQGLDAANRGGGLSALVAAL